MFRASTTIARTARAAAGRRTMASSSGLPLPSFTTVIVSAGGLGAHADVTLQPRGGGNGDDKGPVRAHSIVLLARCGRVG